ncbi:MAG: (deoxy)nucleoside triphosphate pyrophosphohydrolase [Bacteroidia bacterium]|jgi:8-oxo-dGTP diphosphatase|nr:(deoxy)nucleoside triphosphate pyrophosphohydrolase [Bacteroidia bacterium]
MKKIEVVAAIIIYQNKILCLQRKESKLAYISKKYEFPGGKIEIGESKEDAIKREIMEELEMEIYIDQEFFTVEHQYPDFHITMHSYLCSVRNPNLILTEHIDFKWLDKANLIGLDWADADMPIVMKLKTL